MIKIQHTIFALPFALTSMLMAARGLPSAWIVAWILACCVFARTSAMSFNRWADAELDARNPRTSGRAIPAGLLNRRFVLLFALASAALFVVSAAMLNKVALALSPVALLVLLGYSYTKRFTSLSHLVLGLALGIAPIGAWVAVRAEIGTPSIMLGLGVLAWTAGFDLIYACQDVEIDRKEGLNSIPAKLGPRRAIMISRVLHVIAVSVFVAAGVTAAMGTWYYMGIAAAAMLLLAEQWVVDPHDSSRIQMAFFTINSWVGMAVLVFAALDIFLGSR